MLTNNQTPPTPRQEGEEEKCRVVKPADGMACPPCKNKSNISRTSLPCQGATLPRDHRFDKTREALQSTCDNFIAHYPNVWLCTLTFVNPISPQSIQAGKMEFFRRLCSDFPDIHCVWVLAGHPRPHVHFFANLEIDLKGILDQMENPCFGRHDCRELVPWAYDYLAKNLDKSRGFTTLEPSVRKWGVVKGRAVKAEVRVCVRSIKSHGPRAEIWAKHRHLFEPPNDAALSVKYRDYIRRHYLFEDSVPDDEVDEYIETRPDCHHRRRRPMNLKHFRHRLTWKAIADFVRDRSPSEALAEAEAMSAAAQAQAVAAPVPAQPMESAMPAPAPPMGYTLAVTTTVNKITAPTDISICIAVNLVPAPSVSPLRRFARGFTQGFATTAASTAVSYLSVLLFTLLL